MHDLIGWQQTQETQKIQPEWKPEPLSKEQWPPDYAAVWRWRAKQLKKLRSDPRLLKAAKAYYSTRPTEFIMHWMDTYDPRRPKNKWIPFVFFMKQEELVTFLQSLDADQESGLIEKCRDMGATWVCCGYSVWAFLFLDDDATGWGSRKEQLVDKLGDADSIFEKMRLILKRLPKSFLPEGWNWSRHATYMKLINPENGSTITGEAGDNIGRGGRKARYFKDEAAHYERPEKIEAALGDNTNVQIDISSVNGLGNVFHRRRENGEIWYPNRELQKGYVRVMIMDWSDHPLKTQEWYDTRKAKYEREGMSHVFAQEVDRNYAAAVSNVMIDYQWIQSAVDAHIHIPYMAEAYEENKGKWYGGLDVADDGEDRNSLSLREWVVWKYVEEWGDRDPGVTARRAIMKIREIAGKAIVMYDSIGLGAAVKTEYNRLTEDPDPQTGEIILNKNEVPFVPWNAGSSVEKPYERIIPDDTESSTNKEHFANLKAQAWQSLSNRFYKTHKARTEGVHYDPDELISLDSNMPMLEQLKKELAQPTRGQSSNLKMLVDKKPPGTKSPNNADGGMMMYYLLDINNQPILVGNYGH